LAAARHLATAPRPIRLTRLALLGCASECPRRSAAPSSQTEPLLEIPAPDALDTCEEEAPLIARGLGLQPRMPCPRRPLLQGVAPSEGRKAAAS
jgi:hypothetical protein